MLRGSATGDNEGMVRRAGPPYLACRKNIGMNQRTEAKKCTTVLVIYHLSLFYEVSTDRNKQQKLYGTNVKYISKITLPNFSHFRLVVQLFRVTLVFSSWFPTFPGNLHNLMRLFGFVQRPRRFLIALSTQVKAWTFFTGVTYSHQVFSTVIAEEGARRSIVHLGIVSMLNLINIRDTRICRIQLDAPLEKFKSAITLIVQPENSLPPSRDRYDRHRNGCKPKQKFRNASRATTTFLGS